MALPMTPDEFLAVLRAEGVRVAEYPGWRTRSRDAATGKAFGPVHMVLNHHTGGTASLKLVAETGRSDLPAPLAHAHLNKSGLVTMTSAGRANHAGLMAQNAYASFRDEKTSHPSPLASSGTLDGNDVAYGIEVENLGDQTDMYTEAQYDALVRFNAAACRRHGWSAESVAGHLETSVEGKVDPRGPVAGYGGRSSGPFRFTMGRLRLDVAERLRHPASWSPSSSTAEPSTGGTPVADAERKNGTYSEVFEADAMPVPRNHPDAQTNNAYWTGETYLRFIAESLIRIEKKLGS